MEARRFGALRSKFPTPFSMRLLFLFAFVTGLSALSSPAASEHAAPADHAGASAQAAPATADPHGHAPAPPAVAPAGHAAPAESLSAPEALGRLISGNQRFIAGKPEHPRQSTARRGALAGGQQPFAIVLTCADSRVAPELFFDQGLGDLFVLRNAGNVVDDHVLGSIEYAVEHLHAGLVIVVGHSKCGAVAATVGGGNVPGHILSIVESIEPAYESVADQPGDTVENTVRANALRAARQISRAKPILSAAVEAGHLKVVAARYDLATGQVVLLP
jgi:carbonic anhydrase